MDSLGAFFAAIGLIHPAIAVLKGRKAQDPAGTIAIDAIRKSGFFALFLGLFWPASRPGAGVAIGVGMLLFLWDFWHDARGSRRETQGAAEPRVAADRAAPGR